MLRNSLVLLISLAGTGTVFADPWAEGLFPERSKDFGAVPRGSLLTHPFPIHNNSTVPVHLASVRVSCGCVVAQLEQADLAPGQSGAVVVQMHSERFVGDKVVSVHVQFDRPEFQEVTLQVKARSCEDVVLSPDVLDFGRVAHGSSLKVGTTVTFPTGGWQVSKVTSDSDYVHVALQEVTTATGRTYQVQATLDSELAVGKWFTEVWLHTNHPWMERVRVPVRVVVEPLLTVTPAGLSLDPPAPGHRAQKKVLIHGNTPFAIVGVRGGDEHWSIHDETPGKASQHVLTITLDGPVPSPQERSFQIVTDLPQGTVEIHARTENGR
jgi:hypothetical protein